MPLRVLIGVGGGIAAFKAAHLVRFFTEQGHHVQVVPTQNALKFVGAATFEALSGNPVSTDVFDKVDEVQHVEVGQRADLIVIAPATADLIARLAHGRADDLLTSSCLVATCPVVVAPAMHTEMWLNPATQDNVSTLRSRGITVIEPASGRLTGADSGAGRLPDPEHIGRLALAARQDSTLFRRSLEGRRVVVSAGGTLEPLDPVRFLGNASSGRQGFALADVAAQRGARVHIVAGHVEDLPVPSGATVEHVKTALEMQRAMSAASEDADVVIMAAAVADYRPRSVSDSKLKKSGDNELDTISLVENPDILKGLVQRRDESVASHPIIAGFAAETGDPEHSPLDLAREKFTRKGCDVMMCNAVGEGKVFGQDESAGWILRQDENAPGGIAVVEVRSGHKLLVAGKIVDAIEELLEAKR